MRHASRHAVFTFLSFLGLTALGLIFPGFARPGFAAIPRIILIDLGVPGVALDVDGQPAGTTDENGLLRLELDAEDGDVLHLRSADPAWELDVARMVPPADSGASAVYWDLTTERRPRSPEDVVEEAPGDVSPVDGDEAVEGAEPLVSVAPPPDPCGDPGSLRCRQARWNRFEDALGRGDCAAALRTAQSLAADEPALLDTRDTVLRFAEAYLDCGLSATSEDRREAWLRRAAELVLGFGDGELWCEAAPSRLAAFAFDALDAPEAALDALASARDRCAPDTLPPLEWAVYFRLRRGEVEEAAALAAATPGRTGRFLAAWVANAGGDCRGPEVELEASGDLPCTGLPQELCARQYGRILLACGNEPGDFAAAARYLRASLPVDPDARRALADGPGRETLALLAEAEMAKREFAAAADVFEVLLRRPPEDPASAADLWRRYGDALMLGAEGEPGWRAALAAYDRARRGLAPGSLDLALVMNNVSVLHGRLDEASGSDELARDLEALEATLGALPDEERWLRLWLRHNLFLLEIRRLEGDPTLAATEKLERLEALREPVREYQQELRSLDITPGTGASERTIMVRGRRFALALP